MVGGDDRIRREPVERCEVDLTGDLEIVGESQFVVALAQTEDDIGLVHFVAEETHRGMLCGVTTQQLRQEYRGEGREGDQPQFAADLLAQRDGVLLQALDIPQQLSGTGHQLPARGRQ